MPDQSMPGIGTSRVTVIVVAFNHRRFLAGCIGALERAVGSLPARLILVDNASSDGTAEFVRGELLNQDGTATRGGLPAVFIASQQNLGFSGGNNLALARALADGDEFAYLLNPDAEPQPGFLEAALAVARRDPRIAQVQSLVLRAPEQSVVNTWGNSLHFLGFGYAGGDGTPLASDRAATLTAEPHEIAYASGAAMLLRLQAVREVGPLNEELFAYHEDLELSWRSRLAGWRVFVAPASRVGHHYEFSRSPRKFYFMERNRLLVLAWCYRLPTLMLLAPALLTMEAGLWLFALRGGWGREKLRAYAYLTRGPAVRRLLQTRAAMQAARRASDREVTELFTAEIDFPAVSPWLLTRVANPLFRLYWRGARALMRW